MIEDHDKVYGILNEVLLRGIAEPTAAQKQRAGVKAEAIIDLSCRLLLDSHNNLHNAERFAASTIWNSGTKGTPLELVDIAGAFAAKAVVAAAKGIYDETAFKRTLKIIGQTVLGQVTYVVRTTGAQTNGTVQNTHQQSTGRGMGQSQGQPQTATP